MKVYPVFLSIFFLLVAPAYAAGSPKSSETGSSAVVEKGKMLSVSPRAIRKILYGAVAAGAGYSFLFWFPGTMRVVHQTGVLRAINSTHIPRLALDLATIAACGLAFVYDTDHKE